ncbi:MAG: hypothetical protein ACE5JO_10715 [Candidatus Binatia bacterium]
MGRGIFLLGLAGSVGWGVALVEVMGSAYLGFQPNLTGSLIGGIWAFVDGAIGGIAIAWLYNRFCE